MNEYERRYYERIYGKLIRVEWCVLGKGKAFKNVTTEEQAFKIFGDVIAKYRNTGRLMFAEIVNYDETTLAYYRG